MGLEPSPAMTGSREWQHKKVLDIRHLTDSGYVLRFARDGMEFEPGQYVSVGLSGDINMREYSIYSPVDAPYLEILIKEVEAGYLSKKLKQVRAGDHVYVEGPFGFFTSTPEQRSAPMYFIATGTGISPFHSYVGSFPGLDYRLLHGVRRLEERYEKDTYEPSRLVACVSGEEGGDFKGRVTDYLRGKGPDFLDPAGQYYLCGNCDMIYEVYDILSSAGIAAEQIFAEVYF